VNPLNQAQLDKMTPEKRARALAAIARHNTPEARARHYEAIEAVDREVRETGGLTTADGVFHPCRIGEPADPRLAAVGQALRERRTAAGLSLDDVARASGVERSAVAKLERGANPNPTVGTLDRVMHALGGRLRIEFEAEEPVKA
jgi:DNA-binding phage protein